MYTKRVTLPIKGVCEFGNFISNFSEIAKNAQFFAGANQPERIVRKFLLHQRLHLLLS